MSTLHRDKEVTLRSFHVASARGVIFFNIKVIDPAQQQESLLGCIYLVKFNLKVKLHVEQNWVSGDEGKFKSSSSKKKVGFPCNFGLCNKSLVFDSYHVFHHRSDLSVFRSKKNIIVLNLHESKSKQGVYGNAFSIEKISQLF